MVMMEHRTPTLSRRGTAMILSVLAVGGLMGTIAACPPESEPEAPTKPTRTLLVTPAVPSVPSVAAVTPPKTGASSYQSHLQTRGVYAVEPTEATLRISEGHAALPSGGDDIEARLGALEAQIERLTRALEMMNAQTRAGAGPAVPSGVRGAMARGDYADAERAYEEALRRAPGGGLGQPSPIGGGRGYAGGGGAPRIATSGPNPGGGGGFGARVQPDSGEIVVRRYLLPKGPLKELTALMIREDVPILVSPMLEEGAIEVHATETNQQIFKAFVEMICPDSTSSTSRHVEDETTLFERERAAAIRADAEIHERLAMIDARQAEVSARAQQMTDHRQTLQAELARIGRMTAAIEAQAADVEAQAENASKDDRKMYRDQVRELQQQLRELNKAMEYHERQIEELNNQFESIDSVRETLDAEAAEARSRIDR